MIMLILRLAITQEKQRELFQTIDLTTGKVRKQKGCLSHDWYQDTEKGTELILVEEWESRDDLNRYLQSDWFGVLLGAMNTLCSSADIRFFTDSAG